MSWLAFALCLGGLGRKFETATVELPQNLEPTEVALGDINGDSIPDLIVARHVLKKRFARSLAVYFGAKDGPRFRATPDLELDLTPDTSAFAVGDVTSDPGDEIVLFNAVGAFVWRPRAKEDERFAKLCAGSFLWQLGDPTTVFAYPQGLIDVDGDKRVDLVIPEPGGWRVALQRRDANGASDFSRAFALRTPPEASDGGAYVSLERGEPKFRGRPDSDALRVNFSLDSDSADELDLPFPLVSVVERTPAPKWLDFDRDGKLDLIAQSTRKLLVYRQGADGSFPSSPSASYDLPVVADRDRRLDASYGAHALDLDLDGRADCAIFAGDKRADDVRTQALIFVQGSGRGDAAAGDASPLFGARGIPSQLLVIAGFVAASSFERVDADPFPDLVVRTVRPDLIDQLRSISSETIDADLYVYLNKRGVLSKRPDLSYRFPVRLRDFDPAARFIGDASGDGLAELFLRSEPERVRVLALHATREGLEVLAEPLWELAIHADSRLVFQEVRGETTEISIREPHSVIEVRWK